MEMKIRNATLEDAVELTRVESINFPAIEAAKLDTMKCRLNYYPNHFFVMENSQGGIVGFINGMVTNMKDLMDGKRRVADDFRIKYFTGLSWKRIF